MRVTLNEIKEWRNWRKWYFKDFWDNFIKSDSKYKRTFIKLSKIKSLKERKEIIKTEFEVENIREKSKASSLFLHLWLIVGTKENNKEICIEWNKIQKPSIKKLEQLMIKNNCKKIELRGMGFMSGYFKPIVKIEK